MHNRQISREYFKQYWSLFEEGKKRFGVANILHCDICRKPIELSCEKVVRADFTVSLDAAMDINKGKCACTTWEVLDAE